MSERIFHWLERCIDSHSIYDHVKVKEQFESETGCQAVWPVHTHERTREALVGRGLGGELREDVSEDLKECWGYEMASALAVHYAGFHSSKMGRGFKFDDCVRGLKAKGL